MFLLIILVFAAIWGGCLGVFVWIIDDAKVKTITALDEFRPRVGSRVYSAEGEDLLGEYSTATGEWRQLVPLREIPLHLQKAFVATEDDKFYYHKGVRPDAILNAVLYRARTGRFRGGSTISQQLVRIVDPLEVGTSTTFQRKIREAIVSFQVEREYTKDEILELYLNQIFLGGRARGVEAAARQYFGKSCGNLTLAECALLAGLARAPNKNRPDRHPENAVQRRNIVLDQMLENGFITQEQHANATAESLVEALAEKERRDSAARHDARRRPNEFQAAYFVDEAIRRRAVERLGLIDQDELYEAGLEISTTLDMRLQRAAEDALLSALDEFDEAKLAYLKRREKEDEFVPVSGGLVCIDNRPGCEGYVRALVGGRDWGREQFNTVTQGRRQPGSSVKPFVWAAALSRWRQTGFTPSHIENDAPFVRYDDLGRIWEPKNFGNEFHGPVTLRIALQESINIISIKLAERIGTPTVCKFLRDAGVETPIRASVGLTVALGSEAVSVLDQATAYSTLAKNGTYAPPVFVTEIRDRDGFVRYKHNVERRPGAIDPAVAYVVTNLLQGVAQYGTGAGSHPLKRPRAGKTGTTNDSRNVWFCGFTPQYTCVVWVGYRDNRPLGQGRNYLGRYFTGGAIACPIWTKFMIEAHKDLPVKDFDVPSGVVFYNVNYEKEGWTIRGNGLAGGTFREAFLEGTAPPTEIPAFEESDALEQIMEMELLEDLRL